MEEKSAAHEAAEIGVEHQNDDQFGSSDDDKREMQRMGKKQEMHVGRHPISIEIFTR